MDYDKDSLFDINEMVIDSHMSTNIFHDPETGKKKVIDVTRLLALWDIIRCENDEQKELVSPKELEDWKSMEKEVNDKLVNATNDDEVVSILSKVVNMLFDQKTEGDYDGMKGYKFGSNAFHAPLSQLSGRAQKKGW